MSSLPKQTASDISQSVMPVMRGTSVIICCYSDRRWTDVCESIRSVLELDLPADEIVVVVDHNPPLFERLQLQFPDARVIENSRPRGLSGARNTGIATSRGELLVFLDDDATAHPGMLRAMVERTAVSDVLGVTARIEPHWADSRPAWFPSEFLWVMGCTYEGMTPGKVRNLIGAAMCIRRSVFESVGDFATELGRTSSSLPMGTEETELCIRASRAHRSGYFVYEPAASVGHKVTADRATWGYLVKRCFAEGLSKAHLAAIADANTALSSERAYVAHVLPRGVLKGIADVFRGDITGALRALAIAVGLSATIAGYAPMRLWLLASRLIRRPDRADPIGTGTVSSARRS